MWLMFHTFIAIKVDFAENHVFLPDTSLFWAAHPYMVDWAVDRTYGHNSFFSRTIRIFGFWGIKNA